MAINHSSALGDSAAAVQSVALTNGKVIATRPDGTTFEVDFAITPTALTYLGSNNLQVTINGTETTVKIREGMDAIAYAIERNDRRIEALEDCCRSVISRLSQIENTFTSSSGTGVESTFPFTLFGTPAITIQFSAPSEIEYVPGKTAADIQFSSIESNGNGGGNPAPTIHSASITGAILEITLTHTGGLWDNTINIPAGIFREISTPLSTNEAISRAWQVGSATAYFDLLLDTHAAVVHNTSQYYVSGHPAIIPTLTTGFTDEILLISSSIENEDVFPQVSSITPPNESPAYINVEFTGAEETGPVTIQFPEGMFTLPDGRINREVTLPGAVDAPVVVSYFDFNISSEADPIHNTSQYYVVNDNAVAVELSPGFDGTEIVLIDSSTANGNIILVPSVRVFDQHATFLDVEFTGAVEDGVVDIRFPEGMYRTPDGRINRAVTLEGYADEPIPDYNGQVPVWEKTSLTHPPFVAANKTINIVLDIPSQLAPGRFSSEVTLSSEPIIDPPMFPGDQGTDRSSGTPDTIGSRIWLHSQRKLIINLTSHGGTGWIYKLNFPAGLAINTTDNTTLSAQQIIAE